MNSNDNFQAVSELDLDPIKTKLMHAESGEGWSRQKVDAMEFEYRRFLYLMKKFPTESIAPTVDVDTFWHYHILDTQKYAIDCEYLFGYFLHHYPYVGLGGEDGQAEQVRAGSRMREIYQATFGAQGTGYNAGTATAWCATGIADTRAAWCAANASAAGAHTAWCATNAHASNARTAWCATNADATDARTAWCATNAKAADARTAWCAANKISVNAGTAWCATVSGSAKASAVAIRFGAKAA